MITNVLIEHSWLSPTAFVILVLVGPLLGRWVTPRTRLAWVLTGLALVPVAILTFVPVHRVLYARCTMEWAWPTPARVELFANVVLFIPPVLLGTLATRLPHWAFVAGSLLSVAVEATQAAIPAIGRSCSSNDWLSNTIGSFVGALLGAISLLVAARARTREPRLRS